MASDYGRKVARAARTGGGVTARGKRPWGWYFVVFLIFAIGIPLTWLSRNERIASAHPTQTDHWHSAYGFYICDKFADNLPDNFSSAPDPNNPPAIHTHGDGIIHVEPQGIPAGSDPSVIQDVTGKKATLAKFIQFYPGLSVTSTSIQLPSETTPHKNGDKCGDKPAKVKIAVWKNDAQKSPTFYDKTSDVRLKNGQIITIAFVPDGTTIPKPASKSELPSLEGLADGTHQSGASTTTVAGSSSTEAPASTTATTVKK